MGGRCRLPCQGPGATLSHREAAPPSAMLSPLQLGLALTLVAEVRSYDHPVVCDREVDSYDWW